jgi:hypothetical protein
VNSAQVEFLLIGIRSLLCFTGNPTPIKMYQRIVPPGF